jgi:hypothetical protein
MTATNSSTNARTDCTAHPAHPAPRPATLAVAHVVRRASEPSAVPRFPTRRRATYVTVTVSVGWRCLATALDAAEPSEEPAGHTWTWRLTPNGPEQTLVTEIYDWSAFRHTDMLDHLAVVNRGQMQESIKRLAEALRRHSEI